MDEVSFDPATSHRILAPKVVPFISYPYEWCFGQLKATAHRTLAIQKRAIAAGFSLKDASAFNIQFVNRQPVLIDSLLFEPYQEGKPWVAYRQFCHHYLAPLALMSRVDPRVNSLFRLHLEGVPLELATRLLPWKTHLNPRLLIHLHWHAKAQNAYGQTSLSPKQTFPRSALLGLRDSIDAAIRGFNRSPDDTEWAFYYDETNYSRTATKQKLELVESYLQQFQPKTVWDPGANTGRFSQLAANQGAETIAFDIDPACVERNYRHVVARGEHRILPPVLDLSNPSPSLGWDHSERDSFLDRGPADLIMLLALIHHLAIANNVLLSRIASFLRRAGSNLIIEFVPKSDSQTIRLLAGRTDVFADYTQAQFEAAFAAQFEAAFAAHFEIAAADRIIESDRTLYLMRARSE